MITEKIKVKRYIGHHCCEGYLSIKNEKIIFAPKDFAWESLGFILNIEELSLLEVYDIFSVQSYSKQNLTSKALSIKTKFNSQYILGHENVNKLLNLFKLILLKYDYKKRIS